VTAAAGGRAARARRGTRLRQAEKPARHRRASASVLSSRQSIVAHSGRSVCTWEHTAPRGGAPVTHFRCTSVGDKRRSAAAVRTGRSLAGRSRAVAGWIGRPA
jgi:hypothetical protein